MIRAGAVRGYGVNLGVTSVLDDETRRVKEFVGDLGVGAVSPALPVPPGV